MHPAEAQARIAQSIATSKANRRFQQRVVAIGLALTAVGSKIVSMAGATAKDFEGTGLLIGGTAAAAGAGAYTTSRLGKRRQRRFTQKLVKSTKSNGDKNLAANIMFGIPIAGYPKLHSDEKTRARGLQFIFSDPEFWESSSPGGHSYGTRRVDEVVAKLMSVGCEKTVKALDENPIALAIAPDQAARIYEALAYGAELGKRTQDLATTLAVKAARELKPIDPMASGLVYRACHFVAGQRESATVGR